MAALTFEILLFLLVVSFFYYKKDILGPWFFLCLSLFICYSIVLLNYKNWDVDIHPLFTLCIAAVLASWFAGSFLVRIFCPSQERLQTGIVGPSATSFQNDGKSTFGNSKYPYALLALASVALTVIYVVQNLDIGSIASLADFQSAMRANYENESQGNFLQSQVLEIIMAVAYMSVFRLLLDKHYSSECKQVGTIALLVVPVIAFLIGALVSTDRNLFIRFVLYVFVLYILFYKNSTTGTKSLPRLALRVCGVACLVLLLFWLYGLSKKYTSGFFDQLAFYGGSGLNNFNIWVNSFDGPFQDGGRTFSTLQNTLARIGIGEPSDVEWNREFLTYATSQGYVYTSNVYSAFMDYYSDFGLLGLIAIPFCAGVFYEVLYRRAISHKFGFAWILYAFFIYSLVYLPISEYFLARLHFGLVYEVGWLLILYLLLYKMNKPQLTNYDIRVGLGFLRNSTNQSAFDFRKTTKLCELTSIEGRESPNCSKPATGLRLR